ncbi:hypothetical protein [Streptomyces sp. NPDC001404]|uniref:hypothetical protein n=1 Tax=Streptomyces sp. NPDC001404 TaxID=3364571 RepID=UPI0036BEC655
MSRQWWVAQALAASMLAGGIAVAGVAPAWADVPTVTATVPAAQPADQLASLRSAAAEDARNRVHYYALYHPAAEVRTSAWNALRNSRGDEAITEWLAPGGGFDYAKQRARDTRARNKAYIERVVRTHTPEFSPQVRAAAERALKGSVAEQAAFVKSGYAEAQQRDRAAREADMQHKLEVAAKDREFVSSLAEHDPGEQVRTAAQWALRAGAGDADVVEFYGYGWVTGGALDLEEYRTRIADAEAVRHSTLNRLIDEAAAAEKALQGSADAAKARAEAERAWKAVADHAAAAQLAWLAEQAAARAQAENWQNVANAAKAAKESADGIWKNIGDPAAANQDAWAREQSGAGDAAAFWKDMFTRAQDGENRVKG